MCIRLLSIVLLAALLMVRAVVAAAPPQPFLALCYHSVQQRATTPYTTSFSLFAQHMEYLATHGYHPVSLEDVRQAARGEQILPDKPVLLTFDDGYRSYAEFVVPLLRQYGYPSILAIVGRWIRQPPADLPEQLLSWEELRKLADDKLVEVISHSYDLHRSVQYTPQGNVGSVVSVRRYLPETDRYETMAEYRAHLEEDFSQQRQLFQQQLGTVPRAVVWPYGRYNEIALDVARKAGCRVCLTLDEGYASTDRLDRIQRISIGNDPLPEFIARLRNPQGEPQLIRAMQVDLDLIHDPGSEAQTDRNLGRLIDRIVRLGVNTVYLQAFADPDGDGTADAVYFPNSFLPVRADIFGHAAHQMIIRNLRVFAWMPILAYELPDKEVTARLSVQRLDKTGTILPADERPRRLSPFSHQVRESVRQLYADLAAHAQISGILFQDDGFLRDGEDFHEEAARFNLRFLPAGATPSTLLAAGQETLGWTRAKSRFLVDFTRSLGEAVKTFRPGAEFARNIFARPLLQPESERWFAQNFQMFLSNYDQVVLMAYPQMERAGQPLSWLQNLVEQVNRYPAGPAKTVFKIQTFDWQGREWLDTHLLLKELRTILANGGRHLGYYPDNLWENHPTVETIKLEMSTASLPDDSR